MEGQTPAIVEMRKRKMCEKQAEVYAELIALSELRESHLVDCQQDNADAALARILDLGTCSDAVQGLKHYIEYIHLKHEIEGI